MEKLESQDTDYLYKIVLIGNSKVGKTSILTRYTEKTFKDEERTRAAVISSRNIEYNNQILQLQLWDTSGEEEFRSVTNTFYRSAVGALLVYDITNRESFEALEYWHRDLISHGEECCVIILIGNKSDLKADRAVPKDEANKFAQKKKIPYIETSAKSEIGIDIAFKRLASEIFTLSQTVDYGKPEDRTIKLDALTHHQKTYSNLTNNAG